MFWPQRSLSGTNLFCTWQRHSWLKCGKPVYDCQYTWEWLCGSGSNNGLLSTKVGGVFPCTGALIAFLECVTVFRLKDSQQYHLYADCKWCLREGPERSWSDSNLIDFRDYESVWGSSIMGWQCPTSYTLSAANGFVDILPHGYTCSQGRENLINMGMHGDWNMYVHLY